VSVTDKKAITDEQAKGSKGVSNPGLCVNLRSTIPANLLLCGVLQVHRKAKASIFAVPEGIFFNRAEDRCRTTGVNEVFSYIAGLVRLYRKVKAALP